MFQRKNTKLDLRIQKIKFIFFNPFQVQLMQQCMLRKRNVRHFLKKLEKNRLLLNNEEISQEQLESRINGWMGYAKFGDTFNFREKIIRNVFPD